jgi:microcystin-dependent protein
MHTRRFVLANVMTIVLAAAVPAAAQSTRPWLGQIRVVALSPDSSAMIAQLHHEGWLEARGQLLAVPEFPDLFQVVGRGWTRPGVSEGKFALPDIRDPRVAEMASPYVRVLDPGDLVTGGRQKRSWTRPNLLSYWIFVGRDASSVKGDPSVE